MIDIHEMLTTSQAARAIGVAEGTVRSWIRSGRLQATRTPHGALIDRRDVERARPGRGAPGGIPAGEKADA